MFLATDTADHRKRKVEKFLRSDPGISLVLAAINFEWTVCRAVLFLSKTPNTQLRELMSNFYSLEKYKQLWKSEVMASGHSRSLAEIIQNWPDVKEAFVARNRLVHGRDRYTRNMATPHVQSLLKGVKYIDDYCASIGYPLYKRLPVRR